MRKDKTCSSTTPTQIGGDTPLNGSSCCSGLFSSVPFLTEQVLDQLTSDQDSEINLHLYVQGTCFRAQPSFPVSTPGLTIVTKHDNLL